MISKNIFKSKTDLSKMKGIIYQIFIESHPNIHYVGSTIQTLATRWQSHKSDFKTKSKRIPVICKYFEELGIDNFQIRLIKEYDIVDRNHLLAYEQLWINKLKTINLVKTMFSIKKIRAFHNKKYRENNRESIREQRRTFRENNRESIREQKRTYYENNIESIREKGRTYYENNIESIRERKSKLYICPCCPNKEQLLGGKPRHERSLKHIKYIESIQETKE